MTQRPLKLVLVGAGGMGKAWLEAIHAEPEAELVGVVDLNLDAARNALAQAGLAEIPVGVDAVQLAQAQQADAIVNVTIPKAHHPVTTAALFAGFPVLGEKPVADTLPQALSLAAAAEVTGRLFMVSQSRRYNDQLFAMKHQAATLGAAGVLATEFFKAPHFGGFREEMAHPLLLDMAIHPFDSARFLLDAEPISVYCEEFNPAWSWYDGDAAASAIFQMDSGVRFTYTGSWCSPGSETSWNGQWRLSAEQGTVLWDGESDPTVERPEQPESEDSQSSSADSEGYENAPGDGIAGSLREFINALRTGNTPMGEVHQNIMSLAMVEAAVESAESGQRVILDSVLKRAHLQALDQERHDEVQVAMAGWGSLRQVLR